MQFSTKMTSQACLYLLLCVVPLLVAEDATAGSRRMVVRSGDLPEDYHMATASSSAANATQDNTSAPSLTTETTIPQATTIAPPETAPSLNSTIETPISPSIRQFNDTVDLSNSVEHTKNEEKPATESPNVEEPTTIFSVSTGNPQVLLVKESPKRDVLAGNHVENDIIKKGESQVAPVVIHKEVAMNETSAAKDFVADKLTTTRLEPVTEPVIGKLSSLIVPESQSDRPLIKDAMSTVSDAASGRSFSGIEFTPNSMERRSDDETMNFVKVAKKKILTTPRPKSTTAGPEAEYMTDDKLADIAEPRNFYTFSTSTTESGDVKRTTSTLLISEKVVNNNLLNVIDTSAKPADEDTTEALLHRLPLASSTVRAGVAGSSISPVVSRNTIRFGDDFSSTGQSDWVPLVSEQVTGPEWPRFVPSTAKVSTTTEPAQRRGPSSRIRFPSKSSESTQENGTDSSEMDVASWALATSVMTRKPMNGSAVENIPHVSFVTPPDNTKYNVLRERLQTALSRATEKTSTDAPTTTQANVLPLREASTEPPVNETKENELKNTIPDTASDVTNDSRWRPVSIVTPPPSSTVKVLTRTDDNSVKKLDTVTTSAFDNIEYTTMFELMKISTTTPRATSKIPTEKSTTRKVQTTTTDRILVNVVEDETTETADQSKSSTDKIVADQIATDETTQMPTEKRVFYDTSTSTTSTTSTEKSEAVINTEPILNITQPTEVTPYVQKLLDALVTRYSTPKSEDTTTVDEKTIMTTPPTVEVMITTIIPDDAQSASDVTPEKSEDQNRTILPGNGDASGSLTNGSDERAITDGASQDMVSAYLMLTVVASEVELCHTKDQLRAAILKILTEGTNITVGADSLVLLNLTPAVCDEVLSGNRSEDELVKLRHVKMFMSDDRGDFNKKLGEIFLRVWGETGLDFPLQVLKVDLVTPLPEGELEPKMGGGVAAAIAISVIAGLCLILLGMLFIIMKRRQKKFNYGQRCTPVSLDAYSLDSVSIRNSARRKGGRASKRSYGNPAFDDPDIPSHPLNFAGLANFSQEKDQIYEEFSNIPQVAPRPDELPPGVEVKNRYANVIPLPETRVMLTKREGDLHSDYINANFVRGLTGAENQYIAAQAPLESTLADWWRLIWEQQVKVILMVTALQENGVEKCADYLPPNEVTDSLRLFGDFHVTLKKRDVKDKYIVSVLQLKNMDGNLVREVTHLWYVGWPDAGVPPEATSLIAFLVEARSLNKCTAANQAPTLVHCSPGTGRTGVVIACDMLLRGFEQKRVVDIPRCIYKLRRCRAGAVQTRDQYAFIYQVLNAYATKLTGGALDLA